MSSSAISATAAGFLSNFRGGMAQGWRALSTSAGMSPSTMRKLSAWNVGPIRSSCGHGCLRQRRVELAGPMPRTGAASALR